MAHIVTIKHFSRIEIMVFLKKYAPNLFLHSLLILVEDKIAVLNFICNIIPYHSAMFRINRIQIIKQVFILYRCIRHTSEKKEKKKKKKRKEIGSVMYGQINLIPFCLNISLSLLKVFSCLQEPTLARLDVKKMNKMIGFGFYRLIIHVNAAR